MPELEIVTEVAGRVCTLAAATGARVGEGDSIIVVEAMKMEIPAAAPAAGTVKSILVNLDDLVGEGQVVAILQT
jgi:biotin carboxyl carrier protein